MFTREQREMLAIIYGDDLTTLGDVVIARDEERKTCKIINNDGDMLFNGDALGIGMFLGRGGFYYAVLTKRRVKKDGSRRSNSYLSPSANSKYYSAVLAARRSPYTFYTTRDNAEYAEYEYQIFNSRFEFVSVGKVKASNYGLRESVSLEIGERFHNVVIDDCILRDT